MKRILVFVLLLVSAVLSACATVPQNRRAKLADPIMQFEPDGLEAHRKAKFYSTRESAAGGDGVPAGGGCGCQ
jgi:hypothetical protein